MSKISVIVPAYNVEQYLQTCVESILRQTYRDLEIILVDDGSTDRTKSICDELATRDDRIKVVHKENGGLSDARNAGLDVATGEFISFIDGDDFIDEDTYEVMLKAFEDDVQIVVCGYLEQWKNEKREHRCCNTIQTLNMEETYRAFFNRSEVLWYDSVCDKLFRKSLFKNIRFKKGLISEDVDILYRIIPNCGKTVCIPNVFYHYIHRENSITTSTFSIKRLDILKTTEQIVLFISAKYPKLKDDALYYELFWLLSSWESINNAEDSDKFKQNKKDIRKRIRKNLKSYKNIRSVNLYAKVIARSIGFYHYTLVKDIIKLLKRFLFFIR